MSSLELEPLDGRGPDPQKLSQAFATYVLTGGNAAEACRLMQANGEDIKPDTLRYWRDRYPNRLKAIERDYGAELEALGVDRARKAFVTAGDAMLEAIQKTREEIPRIHNNAPAAAQVAANMAKVLQLTGGQILSFTGRPTQVVEHRDAGEILERLQRFGIAFGSVEGSVEEPAELEA